jgi:hypothetical protein
MKIEKIDFQNNIKLSNTMYVIQNEMWCYKRTEFGVVSIECDKFRYHGINIQDAQEI